jgi:hypothetical protein
MLYLELNATDSSLKNRGIFIVFLKDAMTMQEITLLDRRIFERIPVKLPLRFLDSTSKREISAQTCDISAKGIGIVTDEKLLPYTSLEIWLQIPNQEHPLYTRGKVVWSNEVEPNQYRSGIHLEKTELMAFSPILTNMHQNKM